MSGIVAQFPEIIGEPYKVQDNNIHSPLSCQPVIVLSTDAATMAKIHRHYYLITASMRFSNAGFASRSLRP